VLISHCHQKIQVDKMKEKKSNVHVISFRVNSEERDALQRQAQKYGVNLSQWMRQKLDVLTQAH